MGYRTLRPIILIPTVVLAIFLGPTLPGIFAGHEYIPPGYYPDKVIVKAVGGAEEAAKQISEGRLHVYVDPVGRDVVESLRGVYPDVRYVKVLLKEVYMLLNPSPYVSGLTNPLHDENSRRFLAASIDREGISRAVYGGEGEAFLVPLFKGNPLKSLIIDLERAFLEDTRRDSLPATLRASRLVIAFQADPILMGIAETISVQLSRYGIHSELLQLQEVPTLRGEEPWHILLLALRTYPFRGDIVDRLTYLYRYEPVASSTWEELREVRGCWSLLEELLYASLVDGLRACVGVVLKRSVAVGLVAEPAYQLYGPAYIDGGIIHPLEGFLDYVFLRTVRVKGYPIWGGTLILGVERFDGIINPLNINSTVNKLLSLLVYDHSVFQDPYTGMPIFDLMLPGTRTFSDLLGPFRACTVQALDTPLGVEGGTLLRMKLYPYHDGSLPDIMDFEQWMQLSSELTKRLGPTADLRPLKDIEKASKHFLGHVEITESGIVEKREMVGNETVRLFLSAQVAYRSSRVLDDCFKVSRSVFAPLLPWEASLIISAYIKLEMKLPDLVRDWRGLYESARRYMESPEPGWPASALARLRGLTAFISNTATMLVGNGPYHVEKIHWEGGEPVQIMLQAYRYDARYWATAGDLDILTSLYSWRVESIRMNGGFICMDIRGADEQTQRLLASKVLDMGVLVAIRPGDADRTITKILNITGNNVCIDARPDVKSISAGSELLLGFLNFDNTVHKHTFTQPEGSEAGSLTALILAVVMVSGAALSLGLLRAVSRRKRVAIQHPT